MSPPAPPATLTSYLYLPLPTSPHAHHPPPTHPPHPHKQTGQPLSHENESNCHVCASDRDGDLLLCCEACPFVFHTYCLVPPLDDVPPGAWYCPVCEGAEALVDEVGGLDRILAVRTAAGAAAAGGGASDAGGKQQQQQDQPTTDGCNEFFIKWKERSYIHCCWVSNEVMQRAAGIKHIGAANPVSMRLRRFWREQATAAANGDLREAEERGQLVNGINPAWMQVGVAEWLLARWRLCVIVWTSQAASCIAWVYHLDALCTPSTPTCALMHCCATPPAADTKTNKQTTGRPRHC